jgi:hypothetical protein
LSQPTPSSYASYLNTSQTKYSFELKGNYVKVTLYNGGIGADGTASSPYNSDISNNFYEVVIANGIYNNLTSISTSYLSITLDASLNYNVSYSQYLPGIGSSHHASDNIFFSLGNAFTGLPPSNGDGFPSMFLRLTSSQGTRVSFYQSTVVYDVNTASYYLLIDKYNTDSTVNYTSVLTGLVREVFFPVASHYTKRIYLTNYLLDGSGAVVDQGVWTANVGETEIDGVNWVTDNTFTLQYIGITLSAINTQGASALGDLLKYRNSAFLQSKALYVFRQDIIRVVNAIGNNVFRVTNSGNVQSNRVTTSAVSLFVPVNTIPNGTIGGSNDIITLFAEDTLVDSVPL